MYLKQIHETYLVEVQGRWPFYRYFWQRPLSYANCSDRRFHTRIGLDKIPSISDSCTRDRPVVDTFDDCFRPCMGHPPVGIHHLPPERQGIPSNTQSKQDYESSSPWLWCVVSIVTVSILPVTFRYSEVWWCLDPHESESDDTILWSNAVGVEDRSPEFQNSFFFLSRAQSKNWRLSSILRFYS